MESITSVSRLETAVSPIPTSATGPKLKPRSTTALTFMKLTHLGSWPSKTRPRNLERSLQRHSLSGVAVRIRQAGPGRSRGFPLEAARSRISCRRPNPC